MLNANTKNGRVFDGELGRTVPIRVMRAATDRTMPNLARSLHNYSARRFLIAKSEINISCTIDTAEDGRIKAYRVFDAWFEE